MNGGTLVRRRRRHSSCLHAGLQKLNRRRHFNLNERINDLSCRPPEFSVQLPGPDLPFDEQSLCCSLGDCEQHGHFFASENDRNGGPGRFTETEIDVYPEFFLGHPPKFTHSQGANLMATEKLDDGWPGDSKKTCCFFGCVKHPVMSVYLQQWRTLAKHQTLN